MSVYSSGPEVTLRAIADAYANKDADALLGHFAEDARIIGSLRHEDWARKEDWADYLRRELDDFDQLEYGLGEKDSQGPQLIARTDAVEVVTQTVGLRGSFRGRSFAHEGRWTCALRNDDGEWKVIFSQFAISPI